jgi:hypothetical protein
VTQPRYYPGQQGELEQGTVVPDEPIGLPPGMRLVTQDEYDRIQGDRARWIASKDRIVDEYRSQTLAGDSELSFTLTPQFERLWERIEAIIVTGPSQGATGIEGKGSVTSPGAGAAIESINATNIPYATYQVNWSVELAGTISSTDQDNVRLQFGSTTLLGAEMEGAVGVYPQPPVTITVPQGSAVALAVKTIAAGTAGSVYSAQISLIPITGFPVVVQLDDRIWNLNIPSTGIISVSTKALLLAPQHVRQLTASFAGDYSLELIGYADVRNAPL